MLKLEKISSKILDFPLKKPILSLLASGLVLLTKFNNIVYDNSIIDKLETTLDELIKENYFSSFGGNLLFFAQINNICELYNSLIDKALKGKENEKKIMNLKIKTNKFLENQLKFFDDNIKKSMEKYILDENIILDSFIKMLQNETGFIFWVIFVSNKKKIIKIIDFIQYFFLFAKKLKDNSVIELINEEEFSLKIQRRLKEHGILNEISINKIDYFFNKIWDNFEERNFILEASALNLSKSIPRKNYSKIEKKFEEKNEIIIEKKKETTIDNEKNLKNSNCLIF